MWLLRRGGFASASGVWAMGKPWGNHGETMEKWGFHIRNVDFNKY